MDEVDVGSGFIPPEIEDLNQWLPNYEVIDLLACGGMGAVYRARQTSLDRLAAIKVLPPELAVNESFRGSFEAEGKAMAKLSHSNLVGVYDFGEVSDMLYLVMEFVEGSNLYESKGDEAIDAEVAVTLIAAVSAGLAEAHRIGLVHRDIKPANIFITPELVPKLGDFGLAVPDSDIESGLMMGTPAYLAPEVLADPSQASFASDTFALGVILYEMLTGSSIEQGDLVDLAKVPKLGKLPKIVSKALDPKPLLRYQSAEAFEQDLKEWLRKPKTGGLAVSPQGAAMRPNIAPAATSNSGGGGSGMLIGFVVLALIGGLAWMMLKGGSDSDDSEEGAVTTTEEDQEAGKVELEEGIEELRLKQQEKLEKLSANFAEERRELRQEFLQVSGAEGESFLKSVSANEGEIPRYLLPDDGSVSEVLLDHLREFGGNRQEGLDRKFRKEITSLHRDAVYNLRSAKVKPPIEVNRTWEGWVEWLELSPLTIMRASITGHWGLTGTSDGFELHISSSGQQVVQIGEEKVEGRGLIKVNETGGIILSHAGDSSLSFPWALKWIGGRLEGEDAQGKEITLRRQYYDYSNLPKRSVEPDSANGAMGSDGPVAVEGKVGEFQDPQLIALTEKYRESLNAKIEPLEGGYFRVLGGLREKCKKQGLKESVEQIESEVNRIKALNWRGGFLRLAEIPAPGKLPSDAAAKQSVFRIEFEKRYQPIQRTYLITLEKMLSQRKAGGNKGLGELEKAIASLSIPEGTVSARYVKLVSLEEGDLKHTLLAELEILDSDGENLSRSEFTGIAVSSFATNGDGLEMKGELAFDGDSETWWHSSWSGGEREFPHWISFDLGREQLISGFSITSRPYWKNRRTGLTNWVFYVSADGENWSVVGEGTFPRENGLRTHLGFARSN